MKNGHPTKNTQGKFRAAAAEQYQYGSIRGGGSVGSGEESADDLRESAEAHADDDVPVAEILRAGKNWRNDVDRSWGNLSTTI